MLKLVFPILIDKYNKDVKGDRTDREAEEDIKNATVAEEIHGLAEKVPESEREEFYKELNGIIENDNSNQEHNDNGGKAKRRRKVKTRGGKDLFHSVKLFFKKVKDIIVEGVKKVISAIRELFKWIKNGIKVLVREIKKVFTLFRKAVQFVFGKKIVRPRTPKAAILTDYSFDFDNTTTLTGIDAGALAAHIQKTGKSLWPCNQRLIFWASPSTSAPTSQRGPPAG
ncbi:MAG: hypothetical protein KDC75_21455 [Phaeodactylibacter sp.]|nr:hypothetical protein [Phaeodactylibacter sp.]